MSDSAGADLEWGRVGDAELLRALREAEVARRGLEARILGIVGEIERRELADSLGYASGAVLQREQLGVSRAEGARRVRLAAAVEGPAGVALAAGAISVEHVDVIARFRDSLPDTVTTEAWDAAEAKLVQRAETFDPRAVARYAERDLRVQLDPDGALPSERELAAPRNELDLRFNSGGWLEVHGILEPESGALLAAQLGPLAAPRPTDAEGRDARSVTERQGDALAEWVRLGHAGLPLPAEGGERPQLTVTIAWETLRDGVGTATLGPEHLPIPISEARRLACDAQIIPMVLGSDSMPLDIGRASRTIPPHIRRVVAYRDKGCTFPGCDKPGPWCQVHHIQEWQHGGTTKPDNLTMICPAHHRLIHHADWEIRMHHGRPEFSPPPTSPHRPRRSVCTHFGGAAGLPGVVRTLAPNVDPRSVG